MRCWGLCLNASVSANNIILESSARFANSACKRLIVHKVQSSLACRLQVYNSRSNLQGLDY